MEKYEDIEYIYKYINFMIYNTIIPILMINDKFGLKKYSIFFLFKRLTHLFNRSVVDINLQLSTILAH